MAIIPHRSKQKHLVYHPFSQPVLIFHASNSTETIQHIPQALISFEIQVFSFQQLWQLLVGTGVLKTGDPLQEDCHGFWYDSKFESLGGHDGY